MTKQPDPLRSDPTNGAWDDEPPRKTLLRIFDEAAQWPAIRAAIRAALHVTDTGAPDLDEDRLRTMLYEAWMTGHNSYVREDAEVAAELYAARLTEADHE